jgi:hypothetical protein
MCFSGIGLLVPETPEPIPDHHSYRITESKHPLRGSYNCRTDDHFSGIDLLVPETPEPIPDHHSYRIAESEHPPRGSYNCRTDDHFLTFRRWYSFVIYLDCSLFFVLQCELDVSAVTCKISFVWYFIFLCPADHVIFNFCVVSMVESSLITL